MTHFDPLLALGIIALGLIDIVARMLDARLNGDG